MNKELIKLAKENDFEGYLKNEWAHNTKEPLRYYFWLCDLQKWLMEKHNIFIRTGYGWHPLTIENEYYGFNYFIEDINKQNDKEKFNEYLQRGIIVEGHSFDTNEDALEAGLFQALKLLKEINKVVI